jgi:TolA-binding protein
MVNPLRRFINLFVLFVSCISFSCTSQTSKSRFLLAEKLWQEQKYSSAVGEYEKVIQKEGSSDLSVQAQFRAAQTEMIFTREYFSAIRRFNRVIELRPGTPMALEAQKSIGEILFGSLENFEQAILHYTKMIEIRESDPDRPEYFYRVAKSQYSLMRFEESIQTLEALLRLYPGSRWAEVAAFQMGLATSALANQKQAKGELTGDTLKLAIERFKNYLKKYPEGANKSEAELEIATCFEELDQLSEAESTLTGLESSPLLRPRVQQKLNRIKARRNQKTSGAE